MVKYIVYEENRLQKISVELDTPEEARGLTEYHQNFARRFDLQNKKYKWTTVSEFNKKIKGR